MKILGTITLFLGALLTFNSTPLMASDTTANIWPQIPFTRTVDLCRYQNAYGTSRTQYVSEMVSLAQELMMMGSFGYEAQELLQAFESHYYQNQALASRGNHFDKLFESTFVSYIDGYYRELKPRVKKINFRALTALEQRNQPDQSVFESLIGKLDYIAHGSYALAPNCNGNVQVTLTLIGRDGIQESFVGTGRPEYVMSVIASEVFTRFQRTSFPTTIQMGSRELTLVGGLNGSVDRALTPELAEQACQALGARLPNQFELEMSHSYGDWSGGVGLGTQVWAMPDGMVYHPQLQNPSPVRQRWEVNAESFLYYCVR